MKKIVSSVTITLLAKSIHYCICFSTVSPSLKKLRNYNFLSRNYESSILIEPEQQVTVEEQQSTILLDSDVMEAKAQLLKLAHVTRRGFEAKLSDRKRIKELVDFLKKKNPSVDPARAFYYDEEDETNNSHPSNPLTLCGKWTLVYTDAPDIISLEGRRGGPLSIAKLGRIGQECVPPNIKNVIEWKRPDWAKSFDILGTDDSRVIQKVVVEATASRENPMIVDMKVAGLDIFGVSGVEGKEEQIGSPAKYFEENPIELRGPLQPPFGRFEVLYLDEDMRIIRTSQNFVAVNIRSVEEWF